MVIYSASSYVLLGLANLIIMSACMDYCETIESCHGPADTMSDRQHYIHAFNFNKSVEKHLHGLDHFKLSCKKLLEAFPLDQVDGIFVRSVKNCIFSESDPTPLKGPLRLVAVSKEVIEGMLGLDVAVSQSEDFLQYFSGGKLFPGSSPLTHRYGGHQFGYWAGQLGDGRAHLLGEYTSRKGERWELQLKGSGKTPYSRSGDGRAVVRSSVREFLCSEAMHFLGVPTSRAASLIVSEEAVWRDQFYNGKVKKERGAVVLRLATSWFRIGSLEVLAKAEELDLLRKLLDFVIQEHFPSIDSNDPGKYLIFYSRVVNETAHLIAQWMSVGFAHGVCNTDNFSLLSITIDYGPFGFMEAYNPNFVPNTSDEEGRYSIGAQANVGLFNLEKLLEALTPVLTIEQRQGFHKLFKAKLDLLGEEEEDEYLIAFLLKLMEETGADFTMTFRQLSEASMQQLHNMSNLKVMWALQNLASHKMYPEWVSMYLHRLKRQGGDSDEDRQHRMRRINPRYVLRNWMAESAIRKAEGNDFSEVELLQRILAQPYLTQDAAEEAGYAAQPPWWAQGLNVSCSS
ncbi:protein adenylyltransferase SelO, mitochondrial isoform X2 [Oncorhynchus tshawytscha]|uniref:Selenoprotein O n=1 Tax=Oncorhynchus tshawytscha TaxID=74940 RepID=A0A8C8JH59_ONCTS|nr:protein adenylyltransferase SelO, mitochondrial isoform X2 [Oncorhynchus tshawytscha]